eukprot:1157096-Pelagomonas_calceolata.AAC.11
MASGRLSRALGSCPDGNTHWGMLKKRKTMYRKEKEKLCRQMELSLPKKSSIKEKGTHWLRRAVSPLHHKAAKTNANENCKGSWKHPAPKPGCEKIGMKLASEFNGMLMVKYKLFRPLKGVFNVTGPTNTQKEKVCVLPLCRLRLLFRPLVLTVFDFNELHMPLVCNQLAGLPHAVGCRGPLCGLSAAQRMV